MLTYLKKDTIDTACRPSINIKVLNNAGEDQGEDEDEEEASGPLAHAVCESREAGSLQASRLRDPAVIAEVRKYKKRQMPYHGRPSADALALGPPVPPISPPSPYARRPSSILDTGHVHFHNHWAEVGAALEPGESTVLVHLEYGRWLRAVRRHAYFPVDLSAEERCVLHINSELLGLVHKGARALNHLPGETDAQWQPRDDERGAAQPIIRVPAHELAASAPATAPPAPSSSVPPGAAAVDADFRRHGNAAGVRPDLSVWTTNDRGAGAVDHGDCDRAAEAHELAARLLCAARCCGCVSFILIYRTYCT